MPDKEETQEPEAVVDTSAEVPAEASNAAEVVAEAPAAEAVAEAEEAAPAVEAPVEAEEKPAAPASESKAPPVVSDKAPIKAKLKDLQSRRDAALAAGDHAALKRVRAKIRRQKRRLRKAS